MKYIIVALLVGLAGYAGASYDTKSNEKTLVDRYMKARNIAYNVCLKQGKAVTYCDYVAHINTKHILEE